MNSSEVDRSGEPPSATDEESVPFTLRGAGLVLVTVVGLALTIFHLVTGYFGALPNILQRAPHVGLALVLAFAVFSIRGSRRAETRIPLYDWALILITLTSSTYVILIYDRIMGFDYRPTTLDLVMGGAMVLLVLEAARRVIGLLFPMLAVGTLLYAYFGPHFPGIWAHRGVPLDLIIEVLYTSTRGLWGMVTGISATVIAMFVIFGATLLTTGGGRTFMDISAWLSGRTTGGAAKVATIASSLFGAVSGSAAANVATTGTFTIPLMKRLGYRREFAAGVESVASTGGQLMPPIMGAGAFIMAELLAIPYLEVMVAGIVPAVLYYGGVFAAIHFESHRLRYLPIPEEQIPAAAEFMQWRRSAPLFVPLALLVGLLVQGYTPVTCAFWAIIATIALYLVTAPRLAVLKERLQGIYRSLIFASRGLIMIATLIAAAQIVLSMIALTGVGVKFSGLIMSVGESEILLSLVLAMIVAMILGMGLPTAAAYLLAAAVVAPALIRLGIEPLGAHLFVFYFAIVAGLTPPVCGTVFIAASMAESNWVKTAWVSLRLAMPAFIVPYMFVINPSLILVGSPEQIAVAVVTAMIGVIAMAAAAMGYFLQEMRWWERVLLLAVALLLIKSGWQTDVSGVVILAAVITWQRRGRRMTKRLEVIR